MRSRSTVLTTSTAPLPTARPMASWRCWLCPAKTRFWAWPSWEPTRPTCWPSTCWPWNTAWVW